MSTVRTVALELLRKGPPHNQLLSPLTDYLGLCGNHEAAVIKVPYEHQDFLPLLENLRYADQGMDSEALHRRYRALDEVAGKVTEILSSVRGLVAELNHRSETREVMTHLSLVISAAELALLPFELSKVPKGCPGGDGNWFLLQTLAPISLTRQVRTVSTQAVVWPQKPKILLVAAAPRGMKIPLKQHVQALVQAINPWAAAVNPEDNDEILRNTKGMLTVLTGATISAVEEACAKEVYTHVHVLAHGMEDKNRPGKPYGVAFHSQYGRDAIDVVGGGRFAMALRGLRTPPVVDGKNVTRLPAIVTMASCESGHVSSVIQQNGASFAHDLHQSGVPFVVASQFPLSIPGSVHMVEVLYNGLLWGEDPRIVVHRLRKKLFALSSSETHDWASVVCYAALPQDLEEQLQDMRYAQARLAINCAMNQIDVFIDNNKGRQNQFDGRRIERLFAKEEEAKRWLPSSGRYELEGKALLASTEKRKSQAQYRIAGLLAEEEKEREHNRYLAESVKSLRRAGDQYDQVYKRLRADTAMASVGGAHTPKRNILHWVLCQSLSLSVVFGEKLRVEEWRMAEQSALLDAMVDKSETKAWAHATLAELYLLLLAYPRSQRPREVATDQVVRHRTLKHIEELVSEKGVASFEVYSTKRQFERYRDWWCVADFVRDLPGTERRQTQAWDATAGFMGLVGEIVAKLETGQDPDSRIGKQRGWQA